MLQRSQFSEKSRQTLRKHDYISLYYSFKFSCVGWTRFSTLCILSNSSCLLLYYWSSLTGYFISTFLTSCTVSLNWNFLKINWFHNIIIGVRVLPPCFPREQIQKLCCALRSLSLNSPIAFYYCNRLQWQLLILQ